MCHAVASERETRIKKLSEAYAPKPPSVVNFFSPTSLSYRCGVKKEVHLLLPGGRRVYDGSHTRAPVGGISSSVVAFGCRAREQQERNGSAVARHSGRVRRQSVLCQLPLPRMVEYPRQRLRLPSVSK